MNFLGGLDGRLTLSRDVTPAVLWGTSWLREPLIAHHIAGVEDDARAGILALTTDDDLAALRRHIQACPAVVALIPRSDSSENAARVVRALELGVSAILPNDAPVAAIAAALIGAVEGRVTVDPFASELAVRGLRARADHRGRYPITSREREVLGLLVEGNTIAEIAGCLGIGFHTAQTHVKNLYRKLAVGSKAEATAIALRNQLV
jgi:DNA-binding NarL/FixJ family response regulator